MAEKDGKRSWVMVNRAPVLTLWAGVVAEVLGFEHDEALTLGRAVAGLNAYSKGVSLGLFQPTPKEVQEQRRKMRKEETVPVDLLNRADPAKHTDEGLRVLSGESPIRPESVRRYLESKFGETLADVSKAMRGLTKSLPPSQLAGKSPMLCRRNSGRKFLRARKDGEHLVSWTWTSSVRWLWVDHEERLFSCSGQYLIRPTGSSNGIVRSSTSPTYTFDHSLEFQ